MNRTVFPVTAFSCFVILTWLHFEAAAIDPQPYLRDMLPRTAEALLDSIISVLIYVFGQAYAYYWFSVARIKVLPLAVAFLVVPYLAITWPYQYDLSVILHSTSIMTAAVVVLVLSSLIRSRVASMFVSFQAASPERNNKFLFSKYPPKERLDILGFDVSAIIVLLLPILLQ